MLPNLAPHADDQSVTVSFNTPKAITLTAGDLDNGPAALTYSIVSPPQHGTLTGTPPSATYTPNTGYSGPDSFTFKANDGAADSNTATVSITVQAAGPGSSGTPPPPPPPQFKTYRGTYHVTWQWQSAKRTEYGEASGAVEFGNPTQYSNCSDYYGENTPEHAQSRSGPCTLYRAIEGFPGSFVSNWHYEESDGSYGTQAGIATGEVEMGNLFISQAVDGSGQSYQVAFELDVGGLMIKPTATICPPRPMPCFTYDRWAKVFYGKGGCPRVFVAAGPDLSKLEGTASENCTHPGDPETVTQISTITWSLTGS